MINGPVISVGECMIELSDLTAQDGRVGLGFAGDTCNTAIYLARLLGPEGPQVKFATALGDDALSHRIVSVLEAEGIGTDLIVRKPNMLPGIYAIEVDERGERRFHYWRETSAARAMFSDPGLSLSQLKNAGLLYVSGITLAILPDRDRADLVDVMMQLKEAGRAVVFDGNYRPKLWNSADEARAWTDAAMAAATIALPSLDDEVALHGDEGVQAVLARLMASGPSEIVLKCAAEGPMVVDGKDVHEPSCPAAENVIDTTAAGDSFNSGYLAARIRGSDHVNAARSGHALARQVVGYPGAILPRDVRLAR